MTKKQMLLHDSTFVHSKYREVTGRKGREENPGPCRGSDKGHISLGPVLGELWKPGEQTNRRNVQLTRNGLLVKAQNWEVWPFSTGVLPLLTATSVQPA